MNRKYSIVITVYNAEKYLTQCLDSVKKQSYSSWELILVDDGSTDGSREIETEFVDDVNNSHGDCSVTLVINEQNKGAVYSREKGICCATGEYLLFMDADDWWDSDLIKLVDCIINETGADIVQYGYKFKDEKGNDTIDCNVSKKGGNGKGINIVDSNSNSFTYKALTACYSLWSRAIKRSLFDKEEGYYSMYYDINMTNDLLAFSRPLSLATSYCFSDIYPYNYRLLDSSLCHDVSIDKICAYFRSIGWAEKCLREKNGVTSEHKEFFSRRLTNIIFDEYRRRIYSSNKEDIKKIYSSANSVEKIDDYVLYGVKRADNWYKRLYLNSFIKRRMLIPKLLYMYTQIREKI